MSAFLHSAAAATGIGLALSATWFLSRAPFRLSVRLADMPREYAHAGKHTCIARYAQQTDVSVGIALLGCSIAAQLVATFLFGAAWDTSGAGALVGFGLVPLFHIAAQRRHRHLNDKKLIALNEEEAQIMETKRRRDDT